jgi:hypothetical protein
MEAELRDPERIAFDAVHHSMLVGDAPGPVPSDGMFQRERCHPIS